MRLSLARSVLATLFQLVAATASHAECETMAPFCEGFWSYDVVFDGTVIRTELIEREAEVVVIRGGEAVNVKQMMPHTRVTFSVNQAWRGVATQEAEIVEFGRRELRARYIVAARRNSDGTLSAIWCGATQAYDEAGEKLAFLRSLERPAQGGRVFGNVFMLDPGNPSAVTGSDYVPIVTRVTLRGENLVRSLVSTDGRYEFGRLPVGSFRVAIDAPPATKRVGPLELKIANPRACVQRDFWLESARLAVPRP